MFKLSDIRNYFYIDEYSTEDNIRVITFTENITPKSCYDSDCKGELKKKESPESNRREVYDVFGGSLVKIVFKKQGYKCKTCNKDLTLNDFYEPGLKHTQAFEDFFVQRMFDENLSENEASKKYGISKTYASDIVQGYVDRFRSSSFSIKACETISFCKFEYQKKNCCFVCGADSYDGGKLKLLAVYDEYSYDMVRSFLWHLNSKEDVKRIFYDYDPSIDMQTILMHNLHHRNLKIVVNKKSFIDNLKKQGELFLEGLRAQKKKAMDEEEKAKLEKYIEDVSRQCKNFTKEINKIMDGQVKEYVRNKYKGIKIEFDKLQDVPKQIFSSYILPTQDCQGSIDNIYDCKKYEINSSPIRSIIDGFRRRRFSSNLIVVRLSILSSSVRKIIRQSDLGKYLDPNPQGEFFMCNSTYFNGNSNDRFSSYKYHNDDLFSYYVDVDSLINEYKDNI